jgi:hypothetical protein
MLLTRLGRIRAGFLNKIQNKEVNFLITICMHGEFNIVRKVDLGLAHERNGV